MPLVVVVVTGLLKGARGPHATEYWVQTAPSALARAAPLRARKTGHIPRVSLSWHQRCVGTQPMMKAAARGQRPTAAANPRPMNPAPAAGA